MKKNGMRVTSLFLAAVMLASAPVTASAADTPANVEGEVAGSVTGFGSGERCHGSKQ